MSPDGQPKVLGIGSPKGGVGKTQTAVTLAHLAALAGYRVLLVDADDNRSAYEWTTRAGDAMPFEVDTESAPENLVRLRELTDLDLIVVDLPGARNSDAWKALLTGSNGVPVVDALLVPSMVKTMDLRPVTEVIREVVAKAGVPYLLVATMVNTPSLPAALQELHTIAMDGVHVARQVIRDLTVHSDAVTWDRPITAMPGGRRSTARAAEREYRGLAAEVFGGLLGMKWPTDADPNNHSPEEGPTDGP